MAYRNRELVPDIWSLVRERALATGLCSEGWYSEHLGVCRRAMFFSYELFKANGYSMNYYATTF